MKTAVKNRDTGKMVAYVALAGAVGYGIYSWSKKKWPDTDIKNISISVVGLEWPSTDIKNIEISVIGLEYPTTDLRNISISVISLEFPTTDIRNIVIEPIGPEYPTTDIRNTTISVISVEFPSTDIKNIEISVVPIAPPAEYTLEVTIEPPGAGLVIYSPKKATYSADEVVTLVATPNPGYEFDHWGGWPPYPDVGSTSSTLNLTMTANWWVVAAFREKAAPPPPPPPPPPPVYTCPQCGATFDSAAKLQYHIETEHIVEKLYRVTLIDGSTRIVDWDGLRALMVTGQVVSYEEV